MANVYWTDEGSIAEELNSQSAWTPVGAVYLGQSSTKVFFPVRKHRWLRKPSLSTPIDRRSNLTRGLVGFWPFREGAGTKTFDASGKNNHGTLIGTSPGWLGGRAGTSIKFDGSTNTVDITGFTGLNGANTATVALWFNAKTRKAVISQWNTHRLFDLSTTGTSIAMSWRYGGSGGTGTTLQHVGPAGSYELNKWSHVVFIYNNGTSYLYVNGAFQGTLGGGGATLNTAVSETLRVGWNNIPSFFDGRIDDVRIYNRALSAAEVMELYANPLGVFRREITLFSTPGSVSSPPAGQALTISLSQAISFTENPTKDPLKHLLQSITVSDLLTKEALKHFTESYTLSNNVTKELLKHLTQSITFSDALTKIIEKNLSQSVTFTETFDKQAQKNFSEILTLTDSISKDLTKHLTQNMNMSHTVATQLVGIILPLLVTFLMKGNIETHDKIAMRRDLTMTGISKSDDDFMTRDSDQINWDFHENA